jgi:hypothetical protein
MFDRTACADAEPLTAQPFVSIDALAALSALLDLALKDRTPSVANRSAPLGPTEKQAAKGHRLYGRCGRNRSGRVDCGRVHKLAAAGKRDGFFEAPAPSFVRLQ